MQRLLTTGLIGFVYQLCDEYTIEDDELKATINKDDFYEFSENPEKKNKKYPPFFQSMYDNLVFLGRLK